MQQFDLALAPTLEMLLRERSVTRAARALGRSQPAISRELATLRRQLGDLLLVRTSAGLNLTPRAETLLAELPLALAQLNSVMRGAAFDPLIATGIYRVSMNDYEAALFLPYVLRELIEKAPRLRIAVVQRHRPAVEAALNSADISLAIGRFVRPGPLLHHQSLIADEFVLIVARDRHDPTRLQDLDYVLALPFVLIAPGNAGDMRGLMDTRLDDLGKSRFVQISVPHFAMLPSLIATTDAVAFVPKRLLPIVDSQSVDIYDLPLPTDQFEIGMLWHQRSHQDPASRWIRMLFAEAAAQATR